MPRTIKRHAQRINGPPIRSIAPLSWGNHLSAKRKSPEFPAPSPSPSLGVAHLPHVVAGLSDGGAQVKFLSNGSFPTEHLIWLVRDEQVVSLEELHYKLRVEEPPIEFTRGSSFLANGGFGDGADGRHAVQPIWLSGL